MKKIMYCIAITGAVYFGFACHLFAQKAADTVYYFIDAEIPFSATSQNNAVKGMYVHSSIKTGTWKEKETLLARFKEAVKQKFPDQTGLYKTIVFRWQFSQSEIEASYAAKEEKVKKDKYSVTTID